MQVIRLKDVFVESVVPIKPTPVYQIAKVLVSAAFVLGIAMVVLCMTKIIILVVGAAVALGSFFLRRRIQEKTDGEYEYIHCNGQLDIDVVACNERRRHLLTVNLENAVILAPLGHPELGAFGRFAEKDFTGNMDQEPVYCLVVQAGGENQKLLLSLNEKMYDSLKLLLRSKVKK